jgi:hypothetical protein
MLQSADATIHIGLTEQETQRMFLIVPLGESLTENEQAALPSFIDNTQLKTPTSLRTSTSLTDPLIRSISSRRSYRTSMPRTS